MFNSSDLPELRGWDLSPPALSHWRLFAYHSWDSSYHSVRSVAQSEDGGSKRILSFLLQPSSGCFDCLLVLILLKRIS